MCLGFDIVFISGSTCAESQLSVHIVCGRNSSFYQEVQCSLCDYWDGRFPWTTRLHQILFQVRENCYRMLSNVEDSFWGTKTQSSQWKSPGSPQPKKARQVRSNIKSMSICFFGQKGIVHKNLFLLVKQLMLLSTSKFWNVYGRMWEGSNLISGGTTHGCATMTMHQPMLPSWLDGFLPITTWLWCHILPTCPTLHPATFFYFQNWKWSLRSEDFRRWRKFKQSRRLSWACYEKMTSKNASNIGSTAGIVVKPQKGTTLKVMPAPNV